jgi:hypothetical protein
MLVYHSLSDLAARLQQAQADSILARNFLIETSSFHPKYFSGYLCFSKNE